MDIDEITSLIRQAVTLAKSHDLPYALVRRDDGLLLVPGALVCPSTDYLIEVIRPI